MNSPRIGLSLLLGLSILLSGDARAGAPEKLTRLIGKQRYIDAITAGEALLEKGHPDQELIEQLVIEATYLQVTAEDTPEAYEMFQRRWPQSPYTQRVSEQLAERMFADLTAGALDRDALSRFTMRFPRSSRVAEARYLMEEIDWRTARDAGTIEAYEEFLSRWAGARYAGVCEDRLAALRYREARQADVLDGYLAFLQLHPESRFAADARQRSEALAWQRAQASDTVEAWRSYRVAFRGDRADQAYERELALAWGHAAGAHQIPDYRAFEKGYPDTDEAQVAEGREWDLYHFQREPWPGELTPGIARSHRLEDGSYRLYLDVTDRQGAFVGGLQAEHFTIYDAGYAAELIELAGMEHDRPVDMVFVVDISGSMQQEIDGVKDGIVGFAEVLRLRSRDLNLGLVTFIEQVFAVNGTPGQHSPALTDSPRTFQRWVESIRLERGSIEDHLMAIDRATRLTFRPDAQKILIVLSDEGPTLSRRFRDSAAFADMIAARDFSVFCVAPANIKAFQQLAEVTAGATYRLPSNGELGPTMDALAQKTSKQYRLVYRRPPEAPPVIDDLKVTVRVRGELAWLEDAPASSSSDAEISTVAYAPDGRLFEALVGGGLLCDGAPVGAGLPGETITDLWFSPDGAQLWAQTAQGSLFQSRDGGAGFDPASLGSAAVGIAGLPGLPGAWIGSDGRHLWRDDGSGWIQLSSLGLTDTPTAAISASPLAGGAILLLGEDGALLRSVDGGQSFAAVTGAPWTTAPLGLAFHPQREGLVFAYGAEGLFRSLDDGQSWRAVPLSGPPATIQSLLFDPTARRYVVALTDQGALLSDDLGRSWSQEATGLEAGAGGLSWTGAMSPSGQAVIASGKRRYSSAQVADREIISGQVYFDSGQAAPRPELYTHLDAVALRMRRDPSLFLRVEGHTDTDGSDAYNLALSLERATSVVDYLKKKGVPEARLRAVGFGEARPLFENNTASGKAKNRRVEWLYLSPQTSLASMGGMQ